MLHSIMELILLWISKILLNKCNYWYYIAIFPSFGVAGYTPVYILIILCISFLEWIGNRSQPDQFLVARAASGMSAKIVQKQRWVWNEHFTCIFMLDQCSRIHYGDTFFIIVWQRCLIIYRWGHQCSSLSKNY